jgi:Cu-Zn family superoxide dismutase
MHIQKSFLLAVALSASSIAFAADTVTAKAVLAPTQGNSVSGIVHFSQVTGGVKIVADISGLTPGEHGFHIHEVGDCSAPDAMSAGGHFNPTHEAHGAPDAKHHHAGDFGNVLADAAGKVHYELVDNSISLTGPSAILGRSMIVHVNKDDLHSQPVGNAGARVACGVIIPNNP